MYSTLWSWIDLDVKRLEPFLQLSKGVDVAASDSVLLHYPVDFLAAVPIRAAKRKQWSVVCAGTIIMIVFWAITPLQAGIFASTSITKTTPVSVVHSHSFSPVSEQANILNAGFLNMAYGIVWLGQKLPPFTTREVALAPFEAQAVPTDTGTNVTWSTSTVQYGTDLICHPAAVTRNPYSTELRFNDGKGCVAKDIFLSGPIDTKKEFAALYIGYAYDDYVDYLLRSDECPQSSSHTFLAIWQRVVPNVNLQNASELMSLFCETSYYSQEVQANVSVPDLSVLSVSPVGPKVNLSNQIINVTHFEYIIGTGALPSKEDPASGTNRRDLPDGLVLDQHTRFDNFSLSTAYTSMVGFALGSSRLSPESYLDPHNLASAFGAAHKLLFAMAINSLLVRSDGTANVTTGERTTNLDAVILISTFTFLVQVALMIVVALTVYLFIASWQRPSRLSTDPSSIIAIMSLSRNKKLLDLLHNLNGADSCTFEHRLQDQRFQLEYSEKTHDQVLGVRDCSGSGSGITQCEGFSETLATKCEAKSSSKPICPIELSLPVGLVFISLLAAFITVLVVLQWKINQSNGLPLPSSNFVVQQLLLNYLPTSIATLIEPFWVVLNRLLCILVPFDELRRGNATPQTSLTLKYTNLPPQLVLWRALGARHFLLTAVCSVALLANVLTIALSGLFSQYFVYLSDDILLNHLHLSSTQANNTWLKGGIVIDQFYVASSNITANTTLPAWVTPTHFFLPFELPQSADMAARYAANTTAVGAELECREMNSTLSKSFYNFTLNHDATKMNISTYHHQPDGDIFRCFAGLDVQGPPQGIRALEIFAGLGPINSDAPESAFCTSLLVGGWIRSNITLSPKPNTADKWPTFNTTSVDTDQMFMVCQPQLKHSSFEVTVDSLGTILDARSTVANSSITNVTDLFSLSNTLVNAVTTFRSPTWHNDSLAGDWTNYLIQKRINSRAILDPHAPVPLFAPTAALFSEIYTRTFAILLSLNTAWLPKSPLFESTPIPAKVITGHWRVFMNPTMFILAITILSLDLVVAVWLYTAHPKPFLPRMPTSLASVIAFFAAGNVLQDLKRDDGSEGHGCGVEGQIKHLESKRWRFGYGKLFAGSDGVSRVGIERVPFFMPLDQEPEEKERGIDVKKRFRGLWKRKHVRGRGRGFEDL